MQWFDVSKAGLAKILKERGFSFLIYELVANGLDTDSPTVEVKIEWEGGLCQVQVIDEHPEGFTDLTHAWTLFAESEKKGDPNKRGRFNLGEKLVLAVCKTARIETTKGTVIFDAKGRRKSGKKRATGSRFWGWIPMLKREADEMIEAAEAIIAPANKTLTVNGHEVVRPELRAEIEVKALDTVVCDEEGRLKRTKRNTQIHVYAVGPDEEPYIHELGIPVCALEEGDPWHIDVQQKVPLTLARDALTAAFLRKVRLAVLNSMFGDLDEEQANAGWVRETAKEEDITEVAMEHVLDLRFSKKRVAYDPSDPEANKLAISQGYTLITGSQLSKEEWRNARRGGAVRPAGKVTPSNSTIINDPDGESDEYPEEKVTDEMRAVRHTMGTLALRLLGSGIVQIRLAQRPRERSRAWYGGRTLSLNVSKLGKGWFKRVCACELSAQEEFYNLLIHELGHEYSSDHLSGKYHAALTRLGAHLTRLALDEPELFKIKVVSFYDEKAAVCG